MTNLDAVVRKSLETAGIGRGTTVLAAVSGGPDSTALLRALAALREGSGLSLVACIVDHGIRAAEVTAADSDFVRGLCAGLGIRLIEKSVPFGECVHRARGSRRSPEEEARNLRHALLRDAAGTLGGAAIALGHTRDDVIETLLMRVLQGSDVHGLRGIPSRRWPFIRPLLGCTRAEVLAYLDALGQPWREDLTNSDTRYLRNRVRHRLLPLLQNEFPGFRKGLQQMARKQTLAGDFIRSTAAQLGWEKRGEGFAIGAAEFLAAHPAVRTWSLLRLYDRFCRKGASRRLPWRFLAPVVELHDIIKEGTVLRGHGAVLSLRAGRFSWSPDIATRGKKGYFMVVSEARKTEIREAGVRICVSRGPDARAAGEGGVAILADTVRPPMVLRSKRKGDFIRLAGGAKSVKDLLIGMKVPESDRDRIPILTDRSGVLAVLGGALGYHTRARADMLAGDRAGVDRVVVDVEIDMEEGSEQQR